MNKIRTQNANSNSKDIKNQCGQIGYLWRRFRFCQVTTTTLLVKHTQNILNLSLNHFLGISLFITFIDAEWIDDWFELTYPYWTQFMSKDEEPLYLPSIPKANDPMYGYARGM